MDSTEPSARPLAVVTGASSGIGLHLARCAVQHGYDLVVAADRPLEDAVAQLRALGCRSVQALQVDLATRQGVDAVCEATQGRPVDALLANAGQGRGGAFLDQDFAILQNVIDTNVTGTLYLVHRLAGAMVQQGRGRILVTGSIAFFPGAYNAVYNGTKAFIDSWARALRNEIGDTGVTLTLLMPGLTESAFFQRAGMLDTKLGADLPKDDPAEVARAGFDALLQGRSEIIPGWHNKLQAAGAQLMPAQLVAEAHRWVAQPGSARRRPATDGR
ncbi:SDR family NAD(P)-dependent oxidoreductase [Ramlibacter tataouinensis]|uniref:Oxidoreductase n=1 Tax=Ramlibacter tataouinensis (strain ATCC BAA-407 / DSM 14655 / LMG 21543 / TTB310) TaxID=365046 RepID=F5Y2B5_RAMTT|nr:SDR family NAD(P)-dependent oxidoreductase [Ramlibacter tataouinensis]AEG91089.1 Conserved hypothetical protein [Ramlibacter tataouinensis TTB310]